MMLDNKTVLLKLASALNIDLSRAHIPDQKLTILESAAAEISAFEAAKRDCAKNNLQYYNLQRHIMLMKKYVSSLQIYYNEYDKRYQMPDGNHAVKSFVDAKAGSLIELDKLFEVIYELKKAKQDLLLNLPDGFSSDESAQKYIDLLRDRNLSKSNKRTAAQNTTEHLHQFTQSVADIDDAKQIHRILQEIRNIQEVLCKTYQRCYAHGGDKFQISPFFLSIISQSLSVDDLQNGMQIGGIKPITLGPSEAQKLIKDAIEQRVTCRELRELQPEKYKEQPQEQQVSVSR